MNDLHHDNLPDVRELERLANQYFKATPGDPSVESAQRFAQANPVSESQVSDFSPADVGASNSQINHPESFDIKDPQTSLPDPHFYNGEIPKSVAGSGRSPSLQNPSGNYSAEPAGNKSSNR